MKIECPNCKSVIQFGHKAGLHPSQGDIVICKTCVHIITFDGKSWQPISRGIFNSMEQWVRISLLAEVMSIAFIIGPIERESAIAYTQQLQGSDVFSDEPESDLETDIDKLEKILDQERPEWFRKFCAVESETIKAGSLIILSGDSVPGNELIEFSKGLKKTDAEAKLVIALVSMWEKQRSSTTNKG